MNRPPHRTLRAILRLALCTCAALLLGVGMRAAPVAAQGNATLDLARLYQNDLRALAMGNAFGPVARGETALLYNPAGLVQRDLDVKFEYALSVSGAEGDFLTDTLDLTSDSPTSAEVQSYLEKYFDTSQRYRYQTFPNAVANLGSLNFGVGAGLLEQTTYRLSFVDDPTGSSPGAFDLGDSLQLDEQHLNMKVASVGFQLLEGQLLAGVTLKSFTYESQTASETFGNVIANSSIELTTTGDSYNASGFDVGFIWRLESLSFLRAQWSIAFNNVGGIALQSTGSPTLEIPGTANVGFAIQPELPWSPVHLIVTAEMEDVTGEIVVRDPLTSTDYDRSTGQRLHYGAELGFWETSTGNHILNVRVGNHRGLATSGFELNLFSGMRIIYTRYKDDFGYEDNPDVQTFEAAQISLGYAF